MTGSDSTFITRVVLKNYKSIAACDVSLGPLTFLVGPNGSGKSNFIDALRFVSHALSTSLDHAIRERGGINEVRRRSGGHPTHFGIRIEFQLGEDVSGHYAFRISALKNAGYEVQDEECSFVRHSAQRNYRTHNRATTGFRARDGRIMVNNEDVGPAPRDRLYLPISIFEDSWILDRALSSMRFYNLSPSQMRDLQSPNAGMVMAPDGSNVASVLGRITRDHPEVTERIEEYLAQTVSGLRGVTAKSLGNRETLEFRQLVAGAKDPWRFPASSMSDGTLRALGILVALFQTLKYEAPEWSDGVPLVGIEEPETALHPAGAGVLFDALREASTRRQVLVASHSPDLLDNKEVDSDSILAVVAEDGETRIGPVEGVGRSALRDHLYTVGELLRMDQLRPVISTGKSARQVRLFSDGAA